MKWTTQTFLTAFVITAGFISSFAVAQYQISELRGDVKQLQIDVATMRTQRAEDRESMVEVRNDVRWIREAIEKMGLRP